MDAVHEADAVAGPVRHAQPEHAAVEVDRLLHVHGEDQDMGHAPGPHEACGGTLGRGGNAGRAGRIVERRLAVRRSFLGNAQFDQHPVVIAEPEAVRAGPRGRIDELLALAFDVPLEPIEVVLEDTEGQMVEALPVTLGYRDPSVRAAGRVEAKRIAFLANIEAERRVELLCDRQIGDDQIDIVHRVNAQLPGTPRRFDMSSDRGHRNLLLPM